MSVSLNSSDRALVVLADAGAELNTGIIAAQQDGDPNRTVIGVTTFTSRRSGTLSIRSLTRSKPIHIDGIILPRR